MYKGTLQKAMGRGLECGRWGLGRAGESNGEKMGTTVIEQQKSRINKKTKINKGFILG